MMAGVSTVALTYVVTRHLLGRRAALLATLFIATARFHIWWSQEARMYIWATFFALLSTCLMIRLRRSGHITWGLHILSSAAALYTLYLAVLALLLQNVFVVLTVWRKPRPLRFLSKWCLAQLSILALYIPWLYVALNRTRMDSASTAFPFHLIWRLYGTVLATGISTDVDRYSWLLVAFGVLSVTGIALLFLDRRQLQGRDFAGWEIGLLFLLSLVLPPIVIYGLSIPRGFLYSPKPEARYLLIFAPLFYALLAATVIHLWHKGQWGRGSTVAATIVILGTFLSVLPAHYAGRYLRDDYQTTMWTLAAYAQPGDAVLLVSGDRYPVFLYHYSRQFAGGDGPTVYLMPQHSTRFTPQNVEPELALLSDRHPRLWLASFERALQDPENLVERWLDTHRVSVVNVTQGHNYLRLYSSRSSTTDSAEPSIDSMVQPQHPLEHLVDNGVLLGYDLPTTEFRPGDVVQPGLYLQTRGALDLAVRWVNQAGQAIAQQTIAIPASGTSSRIVRRTVPFAVYEYTEPGNYWFEVCAAKNDANWADAGCVRFPGGHVTQSRRLPARKPVAQRRIEIGNGAVLFLGYKSRATKQVQAGEMLTLDLHWQAQTSLDRDYTVFIHLLGPYNPATGGPVWAQDDSYPLGGGHPTSRWMAGQLVADRHELTIPKETPPGIFQIEVGLYDAHTGERLDVAESDENRILLDDIQVTRHQDRISIWR